MFGRKKPSYYSGATTGYLNRQSNKKIYNRDRIGLIEFLIKKMRW